MEKNDNLRKINLAIERIAGRFKEDILNTEKDLMQIRESVLMVLNSNEFEEIEKKFLAVENGESMNISFRGLIFVLGGLADHQNKLNYSKNNKGNEESGFYFLRKFLTSCANENNVNNFLERRSDVLKTITEKTNHGLIDINKLGGRWQEKLDMAMLTAFIGHSLQRRKDDSPYIIHPLETLNLLIKNTDLYSLDTWMATCLHDVFEDLEEYFDMEELKEIILLNLASTDVINLVEGVTKIGSHKEASNILLNMKKIIEEISKDVRCLYMKLADRLHNMSTIHNLNQDDQERIARETLDFYCPLARKFGIRKMEDLLADLSLSVLDKNKKEKLDKYIDEEMYPGKELSEIFTTAIDLYFNDKYYRVKDLFLEVFKTQIFTEKQKRELQSYSSKEIDLFALIDELQCSVDSSNLQAILEKLKDALKLDFNCEIEKRTLHKCIRTGLEDQKIHLSESYSDYSIEDLEKSEPFRILFRVGDEQVMDKIKSKIRFLGEPLDSRDIKEDKYNNYNGILGKANFSILKKMLNEVSFFEQGKRLKELLKDNEYIEGKYEKYTKANNRILIEIILSKNEESNKKGVLCGIYDNDEEPKELSTDFLQKFEEISSDFKSSRDLLAFLKTEILAPNQIKCIGEDGEVIILPKGITLYKLAMRISSHIALNYDYCLINGEKILDLNYVLKDGDQFEFITTEARKLSTPQIFMLIGDDEVGYIKALKQMIQQNIIKQNNLQYDLEKIIEEGRSFFKQGFHFLSLLPSANMNSDDILEADIQRFLSSHPEISDEIMRNTGSFGSLNIEKRFFLAFALGTLKMDAIIKFAKDTYDEEIIECKNSVVFSIYEDISVVDDGFLDLINHIKNIASVSKVNANFKFGHIDISIELPSSTKEKLKTYFLLDLVGKTIYPNKYKLHHKVI